MSYRPLKNLAAHDLAAGRLVAPFESSLPMNSAYYAVSPDAAADGPKVTVFREWLLDEARNDERTRKWTYSMSNSSEQS